MGLRLKYGQPMLIDDVAADFPQLTIIAANPGWPWSDEVLAIAVHKSNVHVDMSGWAPKYFPPNFVQYARTLLQDKMLFGSDWPLLTVDRWQKEFAEHRFPEPVVRKSCSTMRSVFCASNSDVPVKIAATRPNDYTDAKMEAG